MLSGNPIVLVVDDEELMREITQMIIEENGGSVLVAEDGRRALDILSANLDSVSYVFLDFSMPELNGYETLIEMRKIKPDIKVLVASGLNAIPEIDHMVQQKIVKFISKPFREIDLVEAFNSLGRKV